MSDSEIVKEIKKERLKRHFDEVDRLTRLYHPQLYTPLPFHASEDEPWPAVYRPKVEQDANANHMMRKHIHSRAFWKHHGDWERELEGICNAGGTLLEVTAADYLKGLIETNKKIQPTRLFSRTAVEDAFNTYVEIKVNDSYEFRQDRGVKYRGHLIEETSVQEDFEEVKEAHLNLVDNLRTSPLIPDIAGRWKAAKSHSESMNKLLDGVLLAGDIVYPCRFCRGFFKD